MTACVSVFSACSTGPAAVFACAGFSAEEALEAAAGVLAAAQEVALAAAAGDGAAGGNLMRGAAYLIELADVLVAAGRRGLPREERP